MNWLKGFLTQDVDLLVPVVPSHESNYPCGSRRDNSLVPIMSQTCPTETGSPSLLVDPGSMGQDIEDMGRNLEDVLPHLKPWSLLDFSPFVTTGTGGASRIDDAHFLWEERAAILEYEAGFPRADAEARALLEVRWLDAASHLGPQIHSMEPCALSPE